MRYNVSCEVDCDSTISDDVLVYSLWEAYNVVVRERGISIEFSSASCCGLSASFHLFSFSPGNR